MKKLLLLSALSLALVACGANTPTDSGTDTGGVSQPGTGTGGTSTGGGSTNPSPTSHTLTITFSGVSSAPLTIIDSRETTNFSDTVPSGFTKSLIDGIYFVRAGYIDGYDAPSGQYVTLNSDSTLNFAYTVHSSSTPPGAPTGATGQCNDGTFDLAPSTDLTNPQVCLRRDSDPAAG